MLTRKKEPSQQDKRRSGILIGVGAFVSPFIYGRANMWIGIAIMAAVMFALIFVAMVVGWIQPGWDWIPHRSSPPDDPDPDSTQGD